ncbi:MAG: hypothetical protein HS113_16775 [Verrucomicrobiales bacterium]|nr:hypothetical protein [Verrucomicrobiales bacterium]
MRTRHIRRGRGGEAAGECAGTIALAAAMLGVVAVWQAAAADPQPAFPPQAQRPLELEDWPALLTGLAGDPLTNATLRLVTTRALFETGRLPEELFAWVHASGPELLSTSELKGYAGAAHLGETLLQLGYVNGAERLAFDSLEMEGESAAALRTLARLHLIKGLTNASVIFLNRLDAYPEHRAWAARFRAGLAGDAPTAADPTISRIRTNLVTGDRIAAGLTTERLLRQALEANPGNPMAFQFLMAHQLLERRLLFALRTLASSPQVREGPLPRHYAEAVLLHRSLYPGLSLGALLPRVPPAVATNFEAFREMMNRAAGSLEQARPQAWRDFGNTYWYYFFFGPRAEGSRPQAPATPQPHE